MIIVANMPIQQNTVANYLPGSIEREIVNRLQSNGEEFRYDSLNQLDFELKLRKEIVNAAYGLYRSDLSFKVFRESACNPDFWDRSDDGGFRLKRGVRPGDAIQDIYANSSQYGTECATAIMIIYYKALLNVFSAQRFDRIFPQIFLMNWNRIDRLLRETGLMRRVREPLPGDRRYFANPDVDPEVPQWQGENVIDLNGRVYYGHGIGIRDADSIIRILNRQRKEGAEEPAHLLETAGRPDFKNLAEIYYRSGF